MGADLHPFCTNLFSILAALFVSFSIFWPRHGKTSAFICRALPINRAAAQQRCL